MTKVDPANTYHDDTCPNSCREKELKITLCCFTFVVFTCRATQKWLHMWAHQWRALFVSYKGRGVFGGNRDGNGVGASSSSVKTEEKGYLSTEART